MRDCRAQKRGSSETLAVTTVLGTTPQTPTVRFPHGTRTPSVCLSLTGLNEWERRFLYLFFLVGAAYANPAVRHLRDEGYLIALHSASTSMIGNLRCSRIPPSLLDIGPDHRKGEVSVVVVGVGIGDEARVSS